MTTHSRTLPAFYRATDFSPWASLLKMKFVVGHGDVLVALFTWDDCIESFFLMGWSVLSFINALAAPIRISGHWGRRVVLPRRCSPFCCTLCILPQSSLPPFLGCSLSSVVWNSVWAFTKGAWLVVGFCCTLLIRFLPNVCPQSGKIIGSSIKVSLKNEENMDFECTEFSQKRSKGTHESQLEDAKKNKKTASNLNAGKCDQHVIRFSFERVWLRRWFASLFWSSQSEFGPKTVLDPRLLFRLNLNIP